MGIVTTPPVLETYDHYGNQARHSKAYDLRWSSFYGEEGGGSGILTWAEERPVGPDYKDLGYLHEVILRKGLLLELFKGVVLNIDERSEGAVDVIRVTAAGRGALFAFDPMNQIYRDSRPTRWHKATEVQGSFVPNKFSITHKDGALTFSPRRGTRFRANEFTYVRYSMPFDDSVERVMFSSHIEMPWTWPGLIEVRDQHGVLWASTVTSSAEHAIALTKGATYVEIRFSVTMWGENTADEKDVYARLSNLQVVGIPEQDVTTREIARDIIGHMQRYGISDDTSRLEAANALPPSVVFEDDQTPDKILTWCCQFGGPNGELFAWGVDNDNRLYVEKQDLTTVKYIVRRSDGLNVSVQGNIEQSAQRVYVVYSDDQQMTHRTASVVDDEMADRLGGMYRTLAYKPSGTMTAERAALLARMQVGQLARPQTTSTLSLAGLVYNVTGKAKHVNELNAGGLVQLGDFRSREASLEDSDARTEWVSHQLVGVEIGDNGRTARLIPASGSKTFERRMARLLKEEEAGK